MGSGGKENIRKMVKGKKREHEQAGCSTDSRKDGRLLKESDLYLRKEIHMM